MTSHHAKFQLDSSKRSQVIPSQKSINNDDDDDDDNNDDNDDTHPGWIIVRDGKYSVADKNVTLNMREQEEGVMIKKAKIFIPGGGTHMGKKKMF